MDNSGKKQLLKLSEESLMREPEEVFDLLEKIGEGAYGAVYKAMHKESGQLLAIKQVPVDSDLQDIIKEISIMQQCDSHYVVKYYGSYFKNTDLWIVMEYCGAGSVSDIMRIVDRPLKEEEIAIVLQHALKGLEYLHFKRKIHRDIKAGNILLNLDGHPKDEFDEDNFVTAHDTMVQRGRSAAMVGDGGESDDNTMVSRGGGTGPCRDGTITDLGTLVIIDDTEEDDCDTMKRVETGVVDKEAKEYRPGFMEHFDKKEEQQKKKAGGRKNTYQGSHKISTYFPHIPEEMDFRDFLKTQNLEQLEELMTGLDKHLDQELEALRKRYHQKRQPILSAMDTKKKQHFR